MAAASIPGQATALEVHNAQALLWAELGWDSDTSTIMQQEIAIEPAVELSLSERSMAVVSARARVDRKDELQPGRPSLDTYSGLSRPGTIGDAGTLELRDAYLETAHDRFWLKLGKQQIVWGSTDGFKILDAVNPQSFRKFILDDFSDSRIGLWAASLEVPVGPVLAQAVWVPDPTVHELPGHDAYFGFRAPRFRFGAPLNTPLPAEIRTDRPDDAWDDAGRGLRLTGFAAGWDWSVVALSNLDPQPVAVVTQDDDDAVLSLAYRRRELYGFSLATSFGNLALRGEAAIQPDRRFNVRDAAGRIDIVTRDNLSAAIGADTLGPAGVFLNAQLLVDHVRGATDGLVRPATDWLFTLFARKSFLNERLFAELRSYASLTDGDGVIRPGLRFLPTGNTAVSLGMDFFFGEAHGIFGQFADRDRVILRFELML